MSVIINFASDKDFTCDEWPGELEHRTGLQWSEIHDVSEGPVGSDGYRFFAS